MHTAAQDKRAHSVVYIDSTKPRKPGWTDSTGRVAQSTWSSGRRGPSEVSFELKSSRGSRHVRRHRYVRTCVLVDTSSSSSSSNRTGSYRVRDYTRYQRSVRKNTSVCTFRRDGSHPRDPTDRLDLVLSRGHARIITRSLIAP